jgi:thymidylate kinase
LLEKIAHAKTQSAQRKTLATFAPLREIFIVSLFIASSMIIEFIGTTGAGKTTLIAEVQRRLAQTTNVTTPFEVVAAPLGLRSVTHPTAQNLVQEVAGLPFFVRSLPRHKSFVTFTLRMLARQAGFTFSTISNLRSLERKIGVYEISKRYGRERLILVDEGTVLTAHNIFVFTGARYTPEEIARFAALVPLPDVIIYVRAPIDTLIKRSLHRSDRRRELEGINQAQLEGYIKRAVAMFDQIVAAEPIRPRVLIVENPESADGEYSAAVDCVTEFILHSKAVVNASPNVETAG